MTRLYAISGLLEEEASLSPVKFFGLQCLIYHVCKYGYKNSKKATSKTKCCHGQTEKWLFMLE